ncbi:unnamed protein product [Burkholderia pseudomallei]|uniref:Uncharacterized protein n=1 Tax=Burkholderia pseudomallei (strain 1106a) TaxID=357348 RepID=A3NVG9_BURP0|nr:hypothetical protein BURPS1106A_2075 [Burkholderia pseudomallei 1106a]AFR15989.1 hypothetical protein BPC006_I2119 [Burkholderia pseudomallei BPC006]VUD48843.1 unnamed protein product [Burkholderia pseudomallei]
MPLMLSLASLRRNSSGAFFYRVRVSKLFDGDARLRERRISSEWQKM